MSDDSKVFELKRSMGIMNGREKAESKVDREMI